MDDIKNKIQMAFGLCIIAAVVVAVAIHATPGMSLIPAPTSAAPKLTADAYPLYSGVSWSEPKSSELTLGTTTLKGYEIISTPAENVTDLGLVFAPFLAYYRDKLINLGWKEDTALEAGGPGSGLEVYAKGSSTIALEYTSIFSVMSPNEPEQCPCSITLTVFTSTN